MLKPIYDKINNQDIDELFELPFDKFERVLAKMPDGIKDSIKTKTAQKLANDELHDIRIVKVIDKLLGTEFTATLLN